MGARGPVATGDPVLEVLRRAAAELGLRAYVVGGYVRDLLLDRPQPDVDVVVEGGADALAERFAALAGAPAPVHFPRFGTSQVHWLVGSHERLVEFASARAESYPPDSRKPAVEAASIEEDARRRDFTVNALLLDFDGNVHDPLGQGLSDLDARLLRTPLDARSTFEDDPLRMLRAIRFAAQLGFRLDEPILPAIRELRARARPPVLSVERATDELRKMLVGPDPALAIDLLDRSQLLEQLLPEVHACHGVAQGGWHHADVFGHSLEAVALTPPDLELRLAALLHDVGKPVTATPDGRFLRHEEVGADMATAAIERLRLSRQLADRVGRLVRLHLRPVYYQAEWSDGAVRRLARDAGELVAAMMALARADLGASDFPDSAKLDELERRLAEVAAESPSRLAIPVHGDEIMALRGLPPGPEVGRIKARLLELVIEGVLPPEREALLAYVRDNPGL